MESGNVCPRFWRNGLRYTMVNTNISYVEGVLVYLKSTDY